MAGSEAAWQLAEAGLAVGVYLIVAWFLILTNPERELFRRLVWRRATA